MLKVLMPDQFGQRALTTVVFPQSDVRSSKQVGRTQDGLSVYNIEFTDGSITQVVDAWNVL